MTEGETLFLIWTVVSCSIAFGFGVGCAIYNGYFEYKKDERKMLNCSHKYFTRFDKYTHVVYDSELNVSKTTYKFKCSNCGIIKYKEVIDEA